MDDDGSSFFFTWLFGVVCGVALAGYVTTGDWRRDTVERGLAIYCPSNGDWAWIGECEQ